MFAAARQQEAGQYARKVGCACSTSNNLCGVLRVHVLQYRQHSDQVRKQAARIALEQERGLHGSHVLRRVMMHRQQQQQSLLARSSAPSPCRSKLGPTLRMRCVPSFTVPRLSTHPFPGSVVDSRFSAQRPIQQHIKQPAKHAL